MCFYVLKLTQFTIVPLQIPTPSLIRQFIISFHVKVSLQSRTFSEVPTSYRRASLPVYDLFLLLLLSDFSYPSRLTRPEISTTTPNKDYLFCRLPKSRISTISLRVNVFSELTVMRKFSYFFLTIRTRSVIPGSETNRLLKANGSHIQP